jgi:hypothetical protein
MNLGWHSPAAKLKTCWPGPHSRADIIESEYGQQPVIALTVPRLGDDGHGVRLARLAAVVKLLAPLEPAYLQR